MTAEDVILTIRTKAVWGIEAQDEFSGTWQALMNSLQQMALQVVCGDMTVAEMEREAQMKYARTQFAISQADKDLARFE